MSVSVQGVAAAAVAVAAVIAGPAWTAAAAPVVGCDSPETTIAWDPPQTQEVEYGLWWSFGATAPGSWVVIGPWEGSATMSGASGYTPQTDSYWDTSRCTTYVYASAGQGRPVPVGEYTFSAEVHNPDPTPASATTTEPARLIVVPAALTVRAAATPDPSNPRNAIVSAEFIGSWVDTFRENWGTTTPESAPYTPAGTWSIRVTATDGTVLHEATAERAAGDDVLAISSFWPDAPAGAYTVTADFAPTGASATNFAITEAAPVTLTVAEPAPGDGPTASPAPSAPPAVESAGTTLPFWIPLAAGIATVGLLAFAIVQLVRTIRRQRRTPGHTSDGVIA